MTYFRKPVPEAYDELRRYLDYELREISDELERLGAVNETLATTSYVNANLLTAPSGTGERGLRGFGNNDLNAGNGLKGGMYTVNNSAPNYPVPGTGSGCLTVFRETSFRITQMCVITNSNVASQNTFTRSTTDSGTTWSAWNQLAVVP